MPTRTARTIWNGGLQDGAGIVTLVSSDSFLYRVPSVEESKKTP